MRVAPENWSLGTQCRGHTASESIPNRGVENQQSKIGAHELRKSRAVVWCELDVARAASSRSTPNVARAPDALIRWLTAHGEALMSSPVERRVPRHHTARTRAQPCHSVCMLLLSVAYPLTRRLRRAPLTLQSVRSQSQAYEPRILPDPASQAPCVTMQTSRPCTARL